MAIAARSISTVRAAPAARRSVRVHAFRSVKPEGLVAAVAAGSLLLAAPSFASLPEGFVSPQGSSAAEVEARLDELIEARTGKAEALPELTEVPPPAPAKEAAKEAPVVVAAPLAPAVAEPPAPRAAEAPAASRGGLQPRAEGGAAAASSPGPSGGVLIGGGVATLAVVAAAALAGSKGGEGEGAAPAAPAAAAAAAPAEAAPEGGEAQAAAAGVSGGVESANPSSKAE